MIKKNSPEGAPFLSHGEVKKPWAKVVEEDRPRFLPIPYGQVRELYAGSLKKMREEGLVGMVYRTGGKRMIEIIAHLVLPDDPYVDGIPSDDLAEWSEAIPSSIVSRTLPAVLEKVSGGTVVSVTNRGKVVAIVMDMKTFMQFFDAFHGFSGSAHSDDEGTEDRQGEGCDGGS